MRVSAGSAGNAKRRSSTEIIQAKLMGATRAVTQLRMAILSDRWIREQAQAHAMIEPFVEAQRREGCISYGLSSYGYDADRKSTRLNSSHPSISYAVFCLKKKTHNKDIEQ